MTQTTQAERPPVVAPRPFSGPKRYLTPKEAAEYLGIGHSTLSIQRMKGVSARSGPRSWCPRIVVTFLKKFGGRPIR